MSDPGSDGACPGPKPITVTVEEGEKLRDAMYAIRVIDNSIDSHEEFKMSTKWFIVDVSKAEPDVNYPGDLISEHDNTADARIGRAMAILAKFRS